MSPQNARAVINQFARRNLYMMSLLEHPKEYHFRFRAGILAIISELDDICANDDPMSLLRELRTRYRQDVDTFGSCTWEELDALRNSGNHPDLPKALGAAKEGLIELIDLIEEKEGQ